MAACTCCFAVRNCYLAQFACLPLFCVIFLCSILFTQPCIHLYLSIECTICASLSLFCFAGKFYLLFFSVGSTRIHLKFVGVCVWVCRIWYDVQQTKTINENNENYEPKKIPNVAFCVQELPLFVRISALFFSISFVLRSEKIKFFHREKKERKWSAFFLP